MLLTMSHTDQCLRQRIIAQKMRMYMQVQVYVSVRHNIHMLEYHRRHMSHIRVGSEAASVRGHCAHIQRVGVMTFDLDLSTCQSKRLIIQQNRRLFSTYWYSPEGTTIARGHKTEIQMSAQPELICLSVKYFLVEYFHLEWSQCCICHFIDRNIHRR